MESFERFSKLEIQPKLMVCRNLKDMAFGVDMNRLMLVDHQSKEFNVKRISKSLTSQDRMSPLIMEVAD